MKKYWKEENGSRKQRGLITLGNGEESRAQETYYTSLYQGHTAIGGQHSLVEDAVEKKNMKMNKAITMSYLSNFVRLLFKCYC